MTLEITNYNTLEIRGYINIKSFVVYRNKRIDINFYDGEHKSEDFDQDYETLEVKE